MFEKKIKYKLFKENVALSSFLISDDAGKEGLTVFLMPLSPSFDENKHT